tara:strand:+ start:371 stop:565 length:195 start_codon:yes stop_codon:yes gene_type:complete
MQYVVIYQREGRMANMDEWFDTRQEAEKRCEELQGMFNWMWEMNKKRERPCNVWIEERYLGSVI